MSILIVEDEIANAARIAYALCTEGFSPRHVNLGAQALDVIRGPAAPGPELIVLDVDLPDMNGFEVCRRLRKFSDVPINFLTARSDEIDRIVGLKIGADDYLTKPFSPRELVARIRVILRRTKAIATQETMPPSRRFELRLNEARIFFCGLPLDLTATNTCCSRPWSSIPNTYCRVPS
jgi:two-component system catabolic regulation response regulator CreB